jgi:hypothetical protein
MKREFLYKAIDDAQHLIQYTESKTGFAIILLSGIITGIFVQIKDFLSDNNSWLIWVLFALICFCLIIAIWIIILIIRPIRCPINNISIQEKHIPSNSYYVFNNDYNTRLFPFFNSKKFKLKTAYIDYYDNLKEMDKSTIKKVLSVELLKLSYIRNIKSDRFNALLWVLITLLAFFTAFTIMISIKPEPSIFYPHCFR